MQRKNNKKNRLEDSSMRAQPSGYSANAQNKHGLQKNEIEALVALPIHWEQRSVYEMNDQVPISTQN